MKKKKLAILLAALLLCASLFAQSIIEIRHEDNAGLPAVGTVINGFEVKEISDFDMLGAKIVRFEHLKTGATVLYVANEDTNRFFDIGFRTPTEQDTGIPHVFEHSTLDGSEKYPSKELWFNLSFQTYNTYMNASTFPFMTIYPVASLSEDQLLTLADYYTDSVFNPMVLYDKSIFDEEAWRYVLKSPEDNLTIAGTVYSEMLGATTRTRKASKNFQGEIFPGSYIANDSGGNPDVIPEMTWEDIKEYHGKYYHPSNSLSILYGKLDRWDDYLGMLDSYFSAYERKEFDLTDPGYTPITGPVTAEYEYPVEAGSNTTNAATVYYGFVCKDADQETMNKLDLMTTLAGDDSSVLMENLKTAIPYGTFGVGIDFSGPELVVEFSADNVNAEDAEVFKGIVDSSMAQIASEGFDPVAVDSIVAAFKLDILLSVESASIGVDMMPSIQYYWAGTGLTYGFMDYIDSIDNFQSWNDDGSFKDVIRRYVLDNPRNALVTTKAVAGMKEQKDAALAEHLAQVKANMSSDEIAAIVEATNNPATTNADTAAMVRQIQVVSVETLPEEARIYDIQDQTGSDGIRRIWADADVSDVGYAGILLDASGLRQDQILFFKLWTSVLSELDTERHTRGELSSLINRYLYSGTIRTSLIEDDITKEMTPRLRAGFIAMDEDMPAAFDLIHELLFESVYDVSRLREIVSRLKNTQKQSINTNSYNTLIYRALSTASELSAYASYINYLDFYSFLEAVEATLETNPEIIVAYLEEIEAYFNNSTNGIILFGGNKESYENYLKSADAFMASLDKRPIEKQVYDLPVADTSEALIVDTNINYNVIFAPADVLGYDEATGDMDAVATLIDDMYLMPQLRDQRGAYGAYLYLTDDGIYAFTYRDPNIEESYEVLDGLADFVANISIDQETLDGYILSSYSSYAQSAGELTGASNAVLNAVGHEDQNKIFEYMRQLKSIKAETFAQTYAPLFQALVDNYQYYTSGSASAIADVAYAFNTVLNPFGVQDKSQVEITDISEDNPFYDALRFVYENSLMEAVADSEFGTSLPATLGEFSQIMVTLLGGAFTQEDSIAYLAQYGIVPSAPAGTELSVGDLDMLCCNFLAAAAGVQLDSLALEDFAALGIDPEAPATRDMLALEVYYIAN
ncbi:MAG: insulinase family protein [Spirochaetales bacterium]|nr:insulinase family protein [Spirochaetales bacterium]